MTRTIFAIAFLAAATPSYAQDPGMILRHAGELMERSSEYLHRAARPSGERSVPAIDLAVQRQREALELIEELLKEVAKGGN